MHGPVVRRQDCMREGPGSSRSVKHRVIFALSCVVTFHYCSVFIHYFSCFQPFERYTFVLKCKVMSKSFRRRFEERPPMVPPHPPREGGTLRGQLQHPRTNELLADTNSDFLVPRPSHVGRYSTNMYSWRNKFVNVLRARYK